MEIHAKAMCWVVICVVLLIFVPTPVRCGVSLGFIIDDTGSMRDDIDAVSCYKCLHDILQEISDILLTKLLILKHFII